MMSKKYSTATTDVDALLHDIKEGRIAIPEIQRPFVWSKSQVRDLIDSLYRGFPMGYLIVSEEHQIKLKDGSSSMGKMILIDGQQRVTALTTAITGFEVTNKDFSKERIKIAFNPLANIDKDEELFKVQDAAILKSKRWIDDISVVFKTDFREHRFIEDYKAANCDLSQEEKDFVEDRIAQLGQIKNRSVGLIKLNRNLTIDEITDIFVRINQQGVKLNQADFVMSRIAVNEKYGGDIIRKAIEYFSHLALVPEWYADMCKDTAFMESPFASKMKWLQYDKEEIFDPDYNDILRVVYMHKFGRARMKELVSLVDGRDFAAREFREEIKIETLSLLKEGLLDFMNEYSFTNFVLTIKSAGFVAKKLISSSLSLDFAYMLYLTLNNDPTIDKASIKHYVAKWYVLTTLTGRYNASVESQMEQDLLQIRDKGFIPFFTSIEASELSDTFWEDGLIQALETSVISSPYFNVYIAAQVFFGDNSLFLNGCKISDLITVVGDVHHIFPKKYLIHNGIIQRAKYNQIANFTYLDTQVNKAIGDDAPNVYFKNVITSCQEGRVAYGNISSIENLRINLCSNCIPQNVEEMGFLDYDTFLAERRKLMAKKIKNFYYSL